MSLWEKAYFMLFHLHTFQSILYIHDLLCRLVICSQLSFLSALAMFSHPIDFGFGRNLLWLMEYG